MNLDSWWWFAQERHRKGKGRVQITPSLFLEFAPMPQNPSPITYLAEIMI